MKPKSKKSKKSKLMATEIWETEVEVLPNYAAFPQTGDEEKLYVDESTASTEDLSDADMYYWTGSAYASFAVGPRPKRPH